MTQFCLASAMAVLAVASVANAGETYKARVASDRSTFHEKLLAQCPGERKAIDELSTAEGRRRVELLRKLERCGRQLEYYHLELGSAHFKLQDFHAAEAAYRRALKLRVTEVAQLALLESLVRQERLSPSQRKDLESHLGYFRSRGCRRDDLCARLAYVAWHLEEKALTIQAAKKAIELEFPGWQPYFLGGTVLAGGDDAERETAIRWLREARRRGGPAAEIEEFLAELGAQ